MAACSLAVAGEAPTLTRRELTQPNISMPRNQKELSVSPAKTWVCRMGTCFRDSSPFTGLVNDAWPNGNKKYQCAYTNGKGWRRTFWHENGQRQMSAQFTAGVQQGMGQEWWPNGNQRSITTYVDGNPMGKPKDGTTTENRRV